MIVSPALARLRRDPAPQLAAQRAMEAARDAWLAEGEVAAVLAELARYGRGEPLAACPALAGTVTDFRRARAFADGFVARHLAGLRDHPFGHVTVRYQQSAGIAVLQLASSGQATLSLLTYTPAPGPEATTVCFTGGERHEICLAGAGDIRVLDILREEPGRAELAIDARRICAGDRLSLAGPHRTKRVDRPHGHLTVLRLARSAAEPVPAREYRIDDGTLVHVASGDRAESRDEMAAAVLGAMGRTDAVPAIAALTHAGSDHLRWQALCQTLALDTAAGFARLTALAEARGDSLHQPASALRAALIERHPQLAEV